MTRLTKNKIIGLKTIFLAIAVFTATGIFTNDAAALIYWTNSSGSATLFDWSNGGSDKGLFGDPCLVGGDTLMFFPSNFRAESVNGVAAIKSDRLTVELIAHENYQIKGIRLTEYGDYGILTEGKVSVSGTMFLANLDAYAVRWGNFTSNPVSPISSGQGSWTAAVEVNDINWSRVKLVLNNNLMAVSSAGSESFIEKKVFGSAVAIELITEGPETPEPATIAVLSFGGLLLRLRRKY
jgi:hypothetical protein